MVCLCRRDNTTVFTLKLKYPKVKLENLGIEEETDVRMTIVVSFLFVVLTFPIAAHAEKTKEQDWKFNGFVFWVAGDGRDHVLRPRHLWLVFNKQLDHKHKLDFNLILTPEGIPKVIQNCSVTWNKPFSGVESVKVGRFLAPFGWEWWYYRVDRLPTVQYSLINKPLLLRDNGIQLKGHYHSLEWFVAAFAGHRLGGNVPPSEKGEWDYYGRGRLQLADHLWLGVSQRIGPVPAQGIDMVWQCSNCSFAAEGIRSQRVLQWYIFGEQKLSRNVSGVIRFEHLPNDRRWIVGSSVVYGDGQEVKLNLIVSQQKNPQLLGQFVARW